MAPNGIASLPFQDPAIMAVGSGPPPLAGRLNPGGAAQLPKESSSGAARTTINVKILAWRVAWQLAPGGPPPHVGPARPRARLAAGVTI